MTQMTERDARQDGRVAAPEAREGATVEAAEHAAGDAVGAKYTPPSYIMTERNALAYISGRLGVLSEGDCIAYPKVALEAMRECTALARHFAKVD